MDRAIDICIGVSLLVPAFVAALLFCALLAFLTKWSLGHFDDRIKRWLDGEE